MVELHTPTPTIIGRLLPSHNLFALFTCLGFRIGGSGSACITHTHALDVRRIITLLCRGAILVQLFLGLSRESTGNGAEDVEV